MGGIHGNKRFQCEKCEEAFSWRLDMIEHLEECMKVHKKKRNKTGVECYVLEFCFLCGVRILGESSEEASIINGSSQLMYSQQPVMEVLAKIVEENEIKKYADHTHILCKECMDKINKWDEKEQQLKDLGRDITNTFRKRKLNYKEVEPNYKVHRLKCTNYGEVEENILQLESSIGCNKKSDVFMNIDNGVKRVEHSLLKQEISKEPSNLKNKEFHCDCGKIMVDMDALVHHQLTSGCKVRTNSFSCKYCKTSFSERKLLIQHKKICDQSSLVNGGYECDICCRRFLKRGRVETHKRNVHKIGTIDQQLCSYCGRTFGSSYNIQNHLARDHGIGEIKKMICSLCGGKFCDKSSLRNHMINIHKEKKFTCALCGKKFPTAGTMNHHMNEMHNSTYTYDCNICGEQFHVGFKYRYHMRKMHNNVQYGCDSCSRTFVMKGDLYRHVRGVHMGIRDPKRYPCKICGRLFPSLYKVKRHMGSHIQQHQQQQQQHIIGADIGIASGVVGDSAEMYRLSVQQQTSAATTSITIEEDSSCGDQQGHMEHGQTTATISVHHLLHGNVDMANLSADMIVREVGSDNLVAAEQLVVGPVSDIIVSESGQHQGKLLSTSRGQETITLHTESQEGKETCEEFSSIDVKNSTNLVTGPSVLNSSTSTIMPLHQMIIIHEATSNNRLVEQPTVTPIPSGLSTADKAEKNNDQIHAPSLAVTPCSNRKTAAGKAGFLTQLRQVKINTCIQTDTVRQPDQTDKLMDPDTLTSKSTIQQPKDKVAQLQYDHYFAP